MQYIGDFKVNATVNIFFSTSDGSGGAVGVSATIELADFDVYKGVSVIQRTSTAGWTLDETFDGVTGLHSLSIDLSDNTHAGFYAAGNDYTVTLTPDETVDGQTVAAILCQFSIENRTNVKVVSDIALIDAAIDSDSTLYLADHDKTQSDIALVATKIDSDVVVQDAKLDSDMTLVIADHDKTQSDIVLISGKLDSDMVLVVADHDKTQSDIALVDAAIDSDHVITVSDVAAVSTKIDSDTVLADADHDKTQSDIALVDAAIDSDSVLYLADHDKTQSDIVLISGKLDSDQVISLSDLAIIYSDTTIIYSDTTVIEAAGGALTAAQASDLVAIESELIKVYSDTTVVESDTTVVESDTTVLESARVLFSGTSTASSTTAKVFVQAGDPPTGGADDDYNDTIIVVWDGSDKATARVNVRVVDDYDDSDPSFSVSPALGFTPGAGDLVEVYLADAGALTLLNSLTSGFSSTSPNRLIDHLRSIMSKGAVTPSTLGTYDPTTDSLEFQAEQQSLGLGSGFSTSTDSLKEIRDAIDTLIAPAVVSASSLSGSGFLSDVVSLVRKATDEPSQSPKYTDGDIVEYIQAGMDAVMTDIAINTDHPIVVRYSITLVDGTQYYVLPPNVAELIRVAKINSTTGLPEYEVWPGSYMNPGGAGWKLEGNVLRLLRDWNSTDTLELMYYPNSEPAMHKGTSEATAAASVTLMATPTDGTLGKRPNEYVGMLLRVLSSDQNYQEERLITAYDLTTRVATLAKAFDTTPTGTVVYEVVPIFSRTIKHVVALRTAIDILSNEGNSQRMATLNQNYAIKISAMRRQLSKMEGRFPHHFDGDTWDNTNRGGFYGI